MARTRAMNACPSTTVAMGWSGGRPMNMMCGPWTGSTVQS